MPPAFSSRFAIPAIGFIILVALALMFGGLNEVVVVGSTGGPTRLIVLGALGAVVSALMLASGVALWRRTTNARKLAIVSAAATLGWVGYDLLPGNRAVGYFALLLTVIASAALIWVAQRGIGAGTATSA